MNNLKDFITPPNHVGFWAKKLFSEGGEIVDGSVAYIEPNGGGPVIPHVHPDHNHLFVVVSGEEKLTLGDEEKILHENEAFLVRGDVPHSIWNNADTTLVMIGITTR